MREVAEFYGAQKGVIEVRYIKNCRQKKILIDFLRNLWL